MGAVGGPENPEHYAYIRSYSPDDNVEAKAYPRLLVTTSLNDSQVMFWEPAKWVAKLRALKTDANPLYLKVNLTGGHGGSSGRYDHLREIAFSTRSFSMQWEGQGLRHQSILQCVRGSPVKPQEHRKNPIQDNQVAVGVHRDDTMGLRLGLEAVGFQWRPISPMCGLLSNPCQV